MAFLKAALGVLVVASLAAVVGCGSSSSEGTGTSGGSKDSDEKALKAGISLNNFNPFFVYMNDEIKRAADAAGGSVLEPTISNFDAGKQITDIKNLLTLGANGLVVVPSDAKAITPSIQAAHAANVPVVGVEGVIEGGKMTMNVQADAVEQGRTACEWIGKRMQGSGSVLSLEGDPGTPAGRDRTEGFNSCMEEKFPDIDVIGRPTEWSSQKAADATQTVLSATPDLKAIYMQSDTVFLAPVLSALKRAGKLKKVGEPGHILLFGIDGSPQVLDAIRKDIVDADLSAPVGLEGKYAVEYLRGMLNGKTYEAGPTDHGSTLVESSDGTLTDNLPAPLVTSRNVDSPELWANAAAASGSK